jgi:serine/threonine-protein kinase
MEEETSTVRLSRWKILRRLGSGGMGRVYLAKHRKLKKLAAVKILPPDLAGDPEYVKLFVREGRALARLKHPNIVEVFDIDQESGLHFLVMEYVEGVSMKELLEQSGAIAPKVAINIAMDLCRALVHAHAMGFVHRDMKPGNVLLGRSGEVKLTDFGLVREMSPDACTWTDAVLGTPHYMSPEQAKGKPADIRSDIYGLGATLFVVLAGTTPFTGQDTMTVLLKVANDEPPEVRELNQAVPRPLSDLVRRMMHKSPGERPQSAADVFRELEKVPLNGRPTGRRTVSSP